MRRLNSPLNSVKDYNNILHSYDFWKEFSIFDKILIFQEDTMIYKFGIENFYKYDYVGAPWPKQLGVDSCVGNGGFALRTVNASIDCIKNYNNIKIPQYLQSNTNVQKFGKHPEDILFSYGMQQLGYKIPPYSIAKHFSIESVELNKNTIGSHQLYKFNNNLSQELFLNSVNPYFIYNNPGITGHRFGWNFVVSNLQNIFTNKNGVCFNTWTDCEFIYENKAKIPDNSDWVGITHLTPCNNKYYFSVCDINALLTNKGFIKSLATCKGLFTLSKYMKIYMEDMLKKLNYPNIIVDVLYHPVDYITPFFNSTNINNINSIVSIGCQLRKISTIFKVKTSYKKTWLPGRDAKEALKFLDDECKEYNISVTENERKSVIIDKVNNESYDNIMLNNFVLIDVYDASANNALVECIARDIPCFVTNLPATREYIGDYYPLLFNNMEELESMLHDKALILSAYNYLVKRPYLKERLSIDNFFKDILNSSITKNILTVQL